ncbi:hypothetical protein [Streptosporangium sp. LJ11]|uniref:hypothetical protein n=1 Tax=Streptosporangium sp. LJ11 TaxID=3436927 RepID=UPI003F7AA1F7
MNEEELRRKFENGRRRGRDPVNSGTDGDAMTTADSLWLADYCSECGHTFRQGDKVLVRYGPPLQVRHHSPALPCSHQIKGEVVAEDDPRTRRFHQALDDANPPPGGIHTERLMPGDPLLVPVKPRLHCAFCSKTFRPYELAVRCPCSPEEPKCGLGVHRDPGNGNDCYDAWITYGPLSRCPTSFQKVESSGA